MSFAKLTRAVMKTVLREMREQLIKEEEEPVIERKFEVNQKGK